MIEVDGLAEVVLNVGNLDRAVAFYQGLLGLEQISPVDRPGPVFLRAGSANERVPSLVVLVELPADSGSFSGPRTLHHLALTVPAAGFDRARSILQDSGYEVRDGKHPVLSVRTIYVTDPDGNEVELISPELA